jgi:hypothetical protein
MKLKIDSKDLVLGGESRADLLPREVRVQRKVKVVRRRLGFFVILLIVVMLGATALARSLADQAQANLAIEQANTRSLMMMQHKYVEVRKVQQQIELIQAAEQVGAATEINWEQYLGAVQSTLPANVSLDTINIDSITPFSAYSQATAPLQGARVATLTFTAKSSTLPQVPTWLDALATLPGYADASPGSVTRDETGAYSVSITLHINQAAFTNRLVQAGK